MRLGSLDSGWWYVRSPRPPTHFATICKIVRGSPSRPALVCHSPWKRHQNPDQSSTWGVEGGSLQIPSVPSCWKSTYLPSGSSSGVTLSGCLAEHKHKLLYGQYSWITTTSIDNIWSHNSTTTKGQDMHYHWIKDRIAQGQYNLFWASGKQNRADYFTKHHPPAHHLQMCPLYLHTANHVSHMWGCVGLHVSYTLQTMITCDHTARDIFPSKNIAHLIN